MLLYHIHPPHLLVLTDKVVRPGSTDPTVLMTIDWQSQYLAVVRMRVELTCRVTDISYEMVWLKDNRLVESGINENGSLIIESVTREDHGNYLVLWN